MQQARFGTSVDTYTLMEPKSLLVVFRRFGNGGSSERQISSATHNNAYSLDPLMFPNVQGCTAEYDADFSSIGPHCPSRVM